MRLCARVTALATSIVLLDLGCSGQPDEGEAVARLPFVAREGRLQRRAGEGYEAVFLKAVNPHGELDANMSVWVMGWIPEIGTW